MEKNLEIFGDLEGIQAQSEKDLKYLMDLKERYQIDIYVLDPKVTSISRKVQDKKNLLNGNRNYQYLQQLESKIVQQSEIRFRLKDLIRLQEDEVNYSSLKSSCMIFVKDINAQYL